MDDIAFSRIASALQHPMVLIGFCFFLLSGFYRVLVGAGLLPRMNSEAGASLLSRILNYGFILALLITVLGFGLAYLENTRKAQQTAGIKVQTGNLPPSTVRTQGDQSPVIQGNGNHVTLTKGK